MRDLSGLTHEETTHYHDLRFDRTGKQLRLEQEHSGFDWIKAGLLLD